MGSITKKLSPRPRNLSNRPLDMLQQGLSRKNKSSDPDIEETRGLEMGKFGIDPVELCHEHMIYLAGVF